MLIKITKAQVKSIIKKEGAFKGLLCPSKSFPNMGHPFNMAIPVEWTQDDLKTVDVLGNEKEGELSNMERKINEFTYYNCSAEVGKSVHYYIEK
ncbi:MULTISPECIES: hypothetical protein [Bacillus cereus group]|uniref:Uncharacterized protein n=1 Tax=Bacillus thuringiensis TaxID=1428 RepID=A0A9X7ASB0_BACTU|nr:MULTISPECIES: hypothetical protein [Bacillus cereus group]PFT50759.1 hypothetical protein COK72_01790 [Bacillus thuringiensis]PFY22796.1 hypothetical protein COL44_18110 [Bacillus toyonensis]